MAANQFQAKVTGFQWLTPTVFQLGFELDQPLEFKAGQFLSIVIPGAGVGGKNIRRAYSISSPPQNKTIELCIKKVDGGPGTAFLANLKVGDTFQVFAPYGAFIYKPVPGFNAVFLATGTGVSPFRSIVQSEPYQQIPPSQSYCFFGTRSEDEILYQSVLEGVLGLRWITAVSRPSSSWTGFKGRITDYLRSLGDDFAWKQTQYYLCGNGAMIDEVKKFLMETKGVLKEDIHQEIYYKPKPGEQ